MITLRVATVSDAPLLRRWDEDPGVVESDPNDDWNWEVELGRTPPWREQLIGEVDGRPIGFLQIIDPLLEETHYWGECEPNLRAIDIWIGEARDRGHGHGTTMMVEALKRCFAPAAITAVIIDPLLSNTRAHLFYQRMGFHPVGVRFFGEDECWVHRLERADFDQYLLSRQR
jgi:aminoglycoside 6'-N-acetyltransferase